MSSATPRHVEELEDSEKRKAAIHEAGHATVAAVRGVRVRAWIYRNESGDPGEKAWLGHTQANDRTMFSATCAVAGIVAEELDDDPTVTHESIIENWENDYCAPSPADLRYCSEDWRERSVAVKESLTILREQEALFNRIVSELLDRKSLTDGQVADLAKQLVKPCEVFDEPSVLFQNEGVTPPPR